MMHPKLSKNPIAEALFQYRFQCANSVSLDALKIIAKAFASRKIEEIKSITFDVSNSNKPQIENIVGYRVELLNDQDIIHIQADSFTFSRVGLYENWDKFKEAFLRAWQVLEKEISPINIQRIGVRYINKIQLPTTLPHAGMYMNLSPHMTFPTVNSSADEYLLRVGMPIGEIGGRAVVTQLLDRVKQDGLLPIILDIDVFVIQDFKPDLKSQTEILDKIRATKNNIFYNSFTDKGLELYK